MHIVPIIFLLQVELHRLLPLFHDDLPHPLRGVDRAPVGLHAHSEARGQYYLEDGDAFDDFDYFW